MRKAKGQQLAMDWQRRGIPEPGTAEMDRAAGFGLAARGGSTAQMGAAIPSGTIMRVDQGFKVGGGLLAEYRSGISQQFFLALL